jgi:hypothetical protein
MIEESVLCFISLDYMSVLRCLILLPEGVIPSAPSSQPLS